jgi:isopentenyl diphosphate isomerase/L-lactate dehydrogenase-like FMN-dependent dehydrogenase
MADRSREVVSGGQRQQEIYKLGLAGKTPGQPVSVDELARAAKAALKAEAYDYVAGGAGSEETVRANRDGFRRWRIVPRLLHNVAERDLRVDILGQVLPAPIMLAPVGVLAILHKEADLAVARAAAKLDITFILSTASSKTMEEVASEVNDAPRWFQLYWPKNPDLAASFLDRAERSGYRAVVVTLDTQLFGWRERDLQNAYLPFLHGDGLANYFSDPAFHQAIGGSPQLHMVRALEYFGEVFTDPSRTWDDLARLRKLTRLPMLIKGVLHPDDARRAVDCGLDGVIVSNHGGRQVDGAIAAIDALPGVVDAVGEHATVLFDSGIRGGSDVVKAVALGARCVLLGRPYCYGLALNGEQGVYDVLANLIADLDLALGLAGCARISELSRANLVADRDPR